MRRSTATIKTGRRWWVVINLVLWTNTDLQIYAWIKTSWLVEKLFEANNIISMICPNQNKIDHIFISRNWTNKLGLIISLPIFSSVYQVPKSGSLIRRRLLKKGKKIQKVTSMGLVTHPNYLISIKL